MSQMDLREKFNIDQRQCRFGDETTIGDKTDVYTQVYFFLKINIDQLKFPYTAQFV